MAKAGLLFVGTEDGIALYSEPGGMGRWLRVGYELRGMSIQSVWVWADNPLHVLVSTHERLYQSTNGGTSWQPVLTGPIGTLIGSRAAQAKVVCVANNGTIWRSEDAGTTWLSPGSLHLTGTPVLAASHGASSLTVATGQHVASSADHGLSWDFLPTIPAPAERLAVHPDDGSTVVVAHQQLYRSSHLGWQPVATPSNITGGVAILGGHKPVLLVGIAGNTIARSSDNGIIWESSTSTPGWNDSPRVIVGVPYHIDTAFAGTIDSVAVSTDRGATWQHLKGEVAPVTAIAAARLV